MPDALAVHDAILQQAVTAQRGRIFKTIGDAICAVFGAPLDGAQAAVDAQRALVATDWQTLGLAQPLRVRMALQAGEAVEQDGDFSGLVLNRISRLLRAGHGGQVLLADAVAAEVRGDALSGVSLRDLGDRRLRDVPGANRIYQLDIAGLPQTFPPLETLDTISHNLPVALNTCLDREAELADMRRLLLDSPARLVTLLGPGGIGKTRLALHAATQMIDAFPGGVWFVDLSGIRDAALMPSVVAAVLGVRSEADPQRALIEDIGEREMLIVLDNCEQIVDGVARFIAGLLPNAPRLRVLATSRVPLELRGEQRIDIGPLPIEKNDDAGPAVQLFLERAQQIRPSFAMTDENQESVYEICRRVDGIPLALELAAARVSVLSPDALRARLSSRLSLLTSTSRDLPERHQTLRGAIEWSYALLRPEDQAAFRALSVFQGGWSLAGAQAVLGLDDVATMEILGSLRDKSLVRLSETDDAEPRYSMLETIQEYGFDQLVEHGEQVEAMVRHVAHVAAFCEAAALPLQGGPHQARWLMIIDQELGNIRNVLQWVLQQREAEPALQLCASLWSYWSVRGLGEEGQRWFEAALTLAKDVEPNLRSAAMRTLGNLCVERGDLRAAETLFRAALVLSRASGDEPGVAQSLSTLGMVAGMMGRSAEEHDTQIEALALCRELGMKRGTGYCLLNLAVWARGAGETEQALAIHREVMDLQLELRDEVGMAYSDVYVARIHTDRGELDAAAALLESAAAAFERFGETDGLAFTQLCVANMFLKEGNLPAGRDRIESALEGFQARGDRQRIAEALEIFAAIHARAGEWADGAEALGGSRYLRQQTGAVPPPVDAELALETERAIETTLGSRMFALHLDRGRHRQIRTGWLDADLSGLMTMVESLATP